MMLRDELIRRQKEMGTAEVARLAGLGGPFQTLATAMQQASTARNLTREELEKAANSQDKAKKIQDKTTSEVVDAQESMQKMSNQMDKIVKDNVLPNAAKLVKSYSQSLETFIKWANKSMGNEESTGPNIPSGGGAAASQSTSSAEDMAWGGTNVAGMGSAAVKPGGAVPGDVSGDKSGGAVGTSTASAAGALAGKSQQILDTIKSKESSGDYRASNPRSSASGAYQFVDSTWQSLAKKYGIGTEFARAGDAPPQIQDAIASKYVDDILKKTGGDISKVPNVWYTGNVEGQMSADALAANRGQTAQQYQEKWMSEFNKMSAGNQTTSVAPKMQPSLDTNTQQTLKTTSTERDRAYQEEIAKIADQEARLKAAKERVFEARKQMAYKNPNSQVLVQKPDEPWAANGGVFSGPKTGYSATLHGNEAVVPLPSGDKIPVEMDGISTMFDEQVSIMTDHVSRLDELVKLLRTGTEISNRILRVSQV